MPSSARLLVVDDNADNRDMLARRLRKRGYEVHTAPDGDEALHMVEGTEYDLVLLDIMMPGTDGMEVLRRLRTSYAQAELPILMATAKTDSSDVVEALRLGANDYVTKPIDFPVALARIQSHLQTREEAPTVPAPAAALPPDGRAEPGTVLDGRYEVVREIGEGGFAIVFEARQLSTGQLVAVKVLRHHHADDAAGAVERRRFEREMKVIGKLTHPHVVRLIDFGELKARVEAVDGWSEATEPSEATTTQESSGNRRILKRLPYIVMERIDGEPLQALLLRKAPLAIDVTTAIFLPVVSAVAAAHRLGVVHRDLKPPNILVARTLHGAPDPKVLDFGIARPLEEDSSPSHTWDGGVLGTPEYMAPELAQGHSRGDARSDQYALGVILYESLAGHRPFQAATFVELLQKMTKGDMKPLHASRPDLPEGLEAVVLRAMALRPEDRFESLVALGRELVRFAPEAQRALWEPSFSGGFEPPRPPSTSQLPPVRLSEAASPTVPRPADLSAFDEAAVSAERPVGVPVRDSADEGDGASGPPVPAASPGLQKLAWGVAVVGAALALAGALALAFG